jgi:hypothetical protein
MLLRKACPCFWWHVLIVLACIACICCPNAGAFQAACLQLLNLLTSRACTRAEGGCAWRHDFLGRVDCLAQGVLLLCHSKPLLYEHDLVMCTKMTCLLMHDASLTECSSMPSCRVDQGMLTCRSLVALTYLCRCFLSGL